MKNRSIVYLILVLLMLSLILGFSSQDGTASSNTSGQLAALLSRLYFGYDKKTAVEQAEFLASFQYILREFAHVFSYFCLGCTVELFRESMKNQKRSRSAIFRKVKNAILFCIVMAFVDECYQGLLINGRTFQLIDLAKDWIGSVGGIFLVYLIRCKKFC